MVGDLQQRRWHGWWQGDVTPAILHQRRPRQGWLPPEHLQQASRNPREPPNGSKLQEVALSSPHPEPTQHSRPCLALPRLHLWQGGQRLTGKSTEPLNFTAGR